MQASSGRGGEPEIALGQIGDTVMPGALRRGAAGTLEVARDDIAGDEERDAGLAWRTAAKTSRIWSRRFDSRRKPKTPKSGASMGMSRARRKSTAATGSSGGGASKR